MGGGEVGGGEVGGGEVGGGEVGGGEVGGGEVGGCVVFSGGGEVGVPTWGDVGVAGDIVVGIGGGADVAVAGTVAGIGVDRGGSVAVGLGMNTGCVRKGVGGIGVSDGVLIKVGVLVGGFGTYISCPARITLPSLKQFAFCKSKILILYTTLSLKSESVGLTTYIIHPSGYTHCVTRMFESVGILLENNEVGEGDGLDETISCIEELGVVFVSKYCSVSPVGRN